MLEASKTVRKMTPEERIRRNANGEIEFVEWDMHTYVAYLGHELGKESYSESGKIHNYGLEEDLNLIKYP
jgi:hypothetical protein